VLNASRRFRYTLDLKKEEEKEQIRRKIRAHAQVIRAALLFKEAGQKHDVDRELPEILPRGFGIGEEQLTAMTRDHDYSSLHGYGGACTIHTANLT
jgi:Ca2+-transporting ATPase